MSNLVPIGEMKVWHNLDTGRVEGVMHGKDIVLSFDLGTPEEFQPVNVVLLKDTK